ncbi:MAG: CBS domain-containing protein [Bacteroidota bacterium]
MLVRSLTDQGVSALVGSSTITKAWSTLHELGWDAFPVVDAETQELSGIARRPDIEQNANQKDAVIDDIALDKPIYVRQSQHIFEAAQLMFNYKLCVLPVVTADLIYDGVIQKSAVLEALADMLNLAEHGAVISIEMAERDFTLSEIINLIESEGGKVLGLTVEAPQHVEDGLTISFKLNLKQIDRIVATLRRYDYLVTTQSREAMVDVEMRSRASELMHYLDI